MGTDSALMFRQSLRQNEIDILANLSLSGFRNGQLHTGTDRYSRDYLPVILIQKTGFLMIRFKLLFPDDFLYPRKHLLFRKDIARNGEVVGITTLI